MKVGEEEQLFFLTGNSRTLLCIFIDFFTWYAKAEAKKRTKELYKRKKLKETIYRGGKTAIRFPSSSEF
jgi:hypothetical protein